MFSKEEIKRLKKSNGDRDIKYLEKRIDNARTDLERKFWQKIADFALHKDGTDDDEYRLYRDDVADWYLSFHNGFRLYVKDANGSEIMTDQLIMFTMTFEHDFNGKIMSFEQYLDEIVHWDYDSKWEQ